MQTLVKTYNKREQTVTISLQSTEQKVNREGKVKRTIKRSHAKTFAQTETAAITRYKQRLIAIMQAENPKTYKERRDSIISLMSFVLEYVALSL